LDTGNRLKEEGPMMVRTRLVPAWALTLTLTLFVTFAVHGQTGAPGSAAGTAVVNGNSVTLKHGVAYGYGDKLVSLLLSDRPVSVADFKENFAGRAGDPVFPPGMVMGAWKSIYNEGKVKGVALTIKPDKTLMLDDIMVGKPNDTFGVSDSEYTLAITQLTPTRIVGTIKTVKPQVELGSYKYGLDAKFDLAVQPLPLAK
jgi:hypothetical protein